MTPGAFSPRVSVKADRILVFVGSAYHALPREAAASLKEQLAAALEQLDAQEADKA